MLSKKEHQKCLLNINTSMLWYLKNKTKNFPPYNIFYYYKFTYQEASLYILFQRLNWLVLLACQIMKNKPQNTLHQGTGSNLNNKSTCTANWMASGRKPWWWEDSGPGPFPPTTWAGSQGGTRFWNWHFWAYVSLEQQPTVGRFSCLPPLPWCPSHTEWRKGKDRAYFLIKHWAWITYSKPPNPASYTVKLDYASGWHNRSRICFRAI